MPTDSAIISGQCSRGSKLPVVLEESVQLLHDLVCADLPPEPRRDIRLLDGVQGDDRPLQRRTAIPPMTVTDLEPFDLVPSEPVGVDEVHDSDALLVRENAKPRPPVAQSRARREGRLVNEVAKKIPRENPSRMIMTTYPNGEATAKKPIPTVRTAHRRGSGIRGRNSPLRAQ